MTPQGARQATTRATLARLGPPLACLFLLAALVDARAIPLALPIVAAVVWVKPARVRRFAELGVTLACVVALVFTIRVAGDAPGGVSTEIALGALLVSVARALMVPNAAPKGGDLALVVIAAAALGAQGHRLFLFAPMATLALGGAILARDTSIERGASRRVWLAALGFLALAVGSGTFLTWAVPRSTYAVARRLAAFIYERPRSGFDDSLGLGDARAILESDKLVLRLTGDEVDYLRGKVYQAFDGTQWYGLSNLTPATPGVPGENARRVHVESIEKRGVYFAPLAFVVAATPPRAEGVARGPKRSSWDMTEHEGFALASPTGDDVQVPRALRADIDALAREWTAGAKSDAEKLDAIEARLRKDYRYTLSRESFRGSAIRDFLFVHKAGHCELFATAFVLVARAAGIPSRVVGGYRVIERAPTGPGFVVRERHAHAWVEAYASSAAVSTPTWRTWDPTPPSAFLRKPSTLESALESVEEVVGDLTKPRNLGIVLGVVLAGASLVALRRARTARKARQGALGTPLHPELARLEEHLSKSGILRARSEGLFTFASRLEDSGDVPAAEAVRACAALLYGHEGTVEGCREKVTQRIGVRG